jgi:hypothetical protein
VTDIPFACNALQDEFDLEEKALGGRFVKLAGLYKIFLKTSSNFPPLLHEIVNSIHEPFEPL